MRRPAFSALAVAACLAWAAAPSAAPQDSGAAMKAIVGEWSALVNRGENARVATLFRLPAIMEQGQNVYRLRTRADVATWHAGLPCSGRIVQIVIRGRFATAVFVLGQRPGRRCETPGVRVAARFEIARGKIVRWTQVEPPSAPGLVA